MKSYIKEITEKRGFEGSSKQTWEYILVSWKETRVSASANTTPEIFYSLMEIQPNMKIIMAYHLVHPLF